MSLSQQDRELTATHRSLHTRQVPNLLWRTEPEIDSERKTYLAERLAIPSDIQQGVYPFKDLSLSRADIEWLLVTHEDQLGPVDWSDVAQHPRAGLDLRGADLRQINLHGLPLARMIGGRNWTVQFPSTDEQRDMGRAHLEGADLSEAQLQGASLGGAHLEEAFLGAAAMQEAYLKETHLEGADLEGAHLEGANLEGVHLEGANLRGVHLEGATLLGAHLEGANLEGAHLEGANLVGASLRGKPVPAEYLKRVRQWDKDVLTAANLQGAFFDSKTTMEDIVLGEERFGFVSLADVHWGGVNLSVVDWDVVTRLGDERRALQTTWLFNYRQAVRAYRQLATVLREQGLNEEAAYFAYRGEVLQRGVLWRQMLQLRRQGRKGLPRLLQKMASYLLTWPLDLFAGYGYKPMRALLTYLLVVIGFMLLYAVAGTAQASHLSWSQLFIVSMTAFHGGAFLPNQFAMDSPQAPISAIEAFVGLLIEVSLIAAFAQRFFRK
jgi:uncharacterized protein YjbI with pentapeptide repeats